MENKIQLGVIAKDTITGFQGLVIAYCRYLSNCPRVILQPRDLKEDGSPKDAHWFDVIQLKWIEDTSVVVITPSPSTIRNGDLVKHNIHGFEGIVIGITTYINGCIRVGVQATHQFKGKIISEEWFPNSELTIITEQKTKIFNLSSSTGGPMKSPKSISLPR